MTDRERAASDLAALYMDVIPKAMREFRKEMRNSRGECLTVPQFRILAQLSFEAANNRELAEQQGVSVAAMSRMVDWLSEHGYVERLVDRGDRRKVQVQLTRTGRAHFEKFRKEAHLRLQKRMAALNPDACRDLNSGLAALANAVDKIFNA